PERIARPVPRWETLAPDAPELHVLEVACRVFEERLWESEHAVRYVRARAVPEEIARRQRIGYADGHSLLARLRGASGSAADGVALLEIADKIGLVSARQVESGHVTYREFFDDRIVVPELRGGRPVWFIGRAIEEVPTPRREDEHSQ